jgi:hypothetical protein
LEESLSSNNTKLIEKVTAVTKQSAKQVNSLKQTIEQQERDFSEINDMAIQVADEYHHHLKNQRLAESRSTTKQLDHHKYMAASRFKKLNKAQQQVNDLEEHMETIHSKH